MLRDLLCGLLKLPVALSGDSSAKVTTGGR
jgi:hypothetical protein